MTGKRDDGHQPAGPHVRGYMLTYSVEHHDPPIPKSKIPPGDGATDSIVVISLLDEDGGGLSMKVGSRDGKKPTGGHEGELSPQDLFKVWMLWASSLKDNPKLDDSRKALAQAAYELCVNTFMRGPTNPHGERPQEGGRPALSQRESEVMLDLVMGKRIKTIAKQRGLSPKTVSTYRSRLLLKLGLCSNTGLVRYYLDHSND